ncbi:MAG: hypothetical protein LC676_06550 [Loktanella sp.]|nr:hypothetical protein [Loktanella sp.]
MIIYGYRVISRDDIAAVEAVLRLAFLLQGPVLPRFQQLVASRVGARHAVKRKGSASVPKHGGRWDS